MNRDEFNNYVKLLSKDLYRFAYSILRDRQDAEDAVQEVFIRLWNMGERTSEYRSLNALAATITRNYCYDQIRKRHPFTPIETGQKGEQTDISPLEIMEKNESDTVIRKIIDELPEVYKKILILREIEGLEYEEIAVKTGQTVNNLRVILSRARTMVRDEYKRLLP